MENTPRPSRLNDLGYLAGLIDAKGTIALTSPGRDRRGHRRSRRLVLTVAMTEAEPVQRVQQTFGGAVREQARTQGRQTMHVWRLTSSAADELLREVRPYLVLTRRQRLATLALDLPGSHVRGRREKIDKVFKAMREENDKRPMVPRHRARVNPSEPDLHYTAAIIDAQRWVTAAPPRTVTAEIASTDPELASWLRARYGGHIVRHRFENRRPVWTWRGGKHDTAEMLSPVGPLLAVPAKRRHAAVLEAAGQDVDTAAWNW